VESDITLEEALTHATLDIPVAGKVFLGLSRNQSYEAVKQGVIPTIGVGKKRQKALVAPLAAKLGLR
jgi:hypothetical protein